MQQHYQKKKWAHICLISVLTSIDLIVNFDISNCFLISKAKKLFNNGFMYNNQCGIKNENLNSNRCIGIEAADFNNA